MEGRTEGRMDPISQDPSGRGWGSKKLEGVLHPFSIKDIFYDKMDLKHFCFVRRHSVFKIVEKSQKVDQSRFQYYPMQYLNNTLQLFIYELLLMFLFLISFQHLSFSINKHQHRLFHEVFFLSVLITVKLHCEPVSLRV